MSSDKTCLKVKDDKEKKSVGNDKFTEDHIQPENPVKNQTPDSSTKEVLNYKGNTILAVMDHPSGVVTVTDVSENLQDPSLYYGVCLLDDSEPNKNDESVLVFCDKKEALLTVKKHSGARFKVFHTREDAANFSRSSCSTPRSSEFSFLDSPNLQRPAVGEKPSAFKAPRSQEMVKLRKAIECGDAEYFSQMVWANPRYLVSCGDTPAILQEGFRYNALHVAAKYNQGSISSLILSTLEDPTFLPILYSDDSSQVTQQRREFIVDLYLNMPEKGLCETPLHFACKFGCVKVSEVLLRHPACNTLCPNKYGKTPSQVIGERNGNSEVKRQIEALFEAMYFVPVLRSEDNSVQGVVGNPYSLAQPHDPLQDVAKSPVLPSMVIKAKAGPMPLKQAESFYKKWRSSSRLFTGKVRRRSGKDLSLTDPRKGLERIGRLLCHELNVPWSEQWSFMDSWTDISSTEGLQRLEAHLRDLYHRAMAKDSQSEPSSQDLESSNALSPVSLLCHKLEGFHLNSSFLKTSPDMPGLFANRSYSESSCDSDDPQSESNLFNSPDLRSRPGFLSKQHRNLNFSSSTPVVLGTSSASLSNVNGDKTRTENKINNLYFDQMSSSLVSFITESMAVLDKKQLEQSFDSLYPSFKRFLSVSHRYAQDILAELHLDLAREVVKILEDDLTRHQEIILAITKMEALFHKDNNNDDSSSDEEVPRRNNYTRQVKLKKKVLSRRHLKCIFNQIKLLVQNCISFDTKCQCPWEPFMSKGNAEVAKVSSQFGGEDSSEDEFITPPSSYVGSPLSSIGEEIFTPDEGIKVFVQGLCLSKSDLDVQVALEEVDVDPVLYPHIHMWKHAMDSCTIEDINSLSTPHPSRRHSVGGYEQVRFPVSPRPESSSSQQGLMLNTPVSSSTVPKCWRTAPGRVFKEHIRPNNLYDCLRNWEEPTD